MQRHNHDGFSLIELLIVVVIIGIIASIAIPNLLASRRAANEGSAQQSMRTISSCEITYLHTMGLGSYGDLTALGTNVLTDAVLSSGNKSGYTFEAHPQAGPPAQFWAFAVPTTTSGIGQTGTRRFAISEDAVLRGDTTLSAPADLAAVQAMTPIGN
ncbi:MAG TPA: prepilin-type N-terminal cleavage/methylation domain-containing protein [Pyrinomonadaceae bacterium]|nr:prepilin-type N-terminal cleavage/methylation domain-containing protein [Pyrinomonadaceae bacterium]